MYKGNEQHNKRRDAAFLKGWDAALIEGESAINPYSRRDYRRIWQNAYKRCMASDPLPPGVHCRTYGLYPS